MYLFICGLGKSVSKFEGKRGTGKKLFSRRLAIMILLYVDCAISISSSKSSYDTHFVTQCMSHNPNAQFPFHHRSPVLALILSRNACHTIQCLVAFQVSRLHAVRTTVAMTKHFTEVKRLLLYCSYNFQITCGAHCDLVNFLIARKP